MKVVDVTPLLRKLHVRVTCSFVGTTYDPSECWDLWANLSTPKHGCGTTGLLEEKGAL